MKIIVKVEIESAGDAPPRIAFAHFEAISYTHPDEVNGLDLEAEFATDDEGDPFGPVPEGFWTTVTAYLWREWETGRPLLACSTKPETWFPRYSEYFLELQDQHP